MMYLNGILDIPCLWMDKMSFDFNENNVKSYICPTYLVFFMSSAPRYQEFCLTLMTWTRSQGLCVCNFPWCQAKPDELTHYVLQVITFPPLHTRLFLVWITYYPVIQNKILYITSDLGPFLSLYITFKVIYGLFGARIYYFHK